MQKISSLAMQGLVLFDMIKYMTSGTEAEATPLQQFNDLMLILLDFFKQIEDFITCGSWKYNLYQ